MLRITSVGVLMFKWRPTSNYLSTNCK